ncbi:MAG: alpha/beta hydrolase [Actinobacteria bacterium]|nr:alpha/beta hydrolase [Actinomycetota bacterium]
MRRRSEIVAVGPASIETWVDGDDGHPDLVILPSYGRDGGDDFDPFTAAVTAAGYRVLRPQPRGIARSTGPMTGVTLGDLAGDIAGVIGKLGTEPAVVLGHAFGNFVGRALAADHPGAISVLILAAASGKNIPPEINSAPFRAADLTVPEDERLAVLRQAFFAPGHDPSAWLTGWYPETLRMQREAAAASGSTAGGADGNAASPLSRYWTAGTVPIYEITAECDPFHPKDQWGLLRSELGSRVTSTVVEDASHALFPEQPAAVAEAVIGYLRTATGGRTR